MSTIETPTTGRALASCPICGAAHWVKIESGADPTDELQRACPTCARYKLKAERRSQERRVKLLGYNTYDGKPTHVTLRFREGVLINPRAMAQSSMVGWGKWQHSQKLPCDAGHCWEVSTAGHGGYILVTQQFLRWAGCTSLSVEHEGLEAHVYEFEEDSQYAVLEAHDATLRAAVAAKRTARKEPT